MEGRYLGWVGRGRERVRQPQKKRGDRGRKFVPRDKCASSSFLQAFIKEREGKNNSAAISMVLVLLWRRERCLLILPNTLVIIPTSMIKTKKETLPMKSPEIQIVALVQFIVHPHLDTCTATDTHTCTHTKVLSCCNHYHVNKTKYSPIAPPKSFI